MKLITGLVFVDFKKAFDVMDHRLLLRKLELYRFSHAALSWFTSYLTNRFQFVALEGNLSERLAVKQGVPQGSVLGSLLFLLFVNDLPLHLERSSVDIFADDTTLSGNAHFVDISSLTDNLNSDLDALNKWSAQNKMFINTKKTKLMVVAGKRIPVKLSCDASQCLNLKIGNEKISDVTSHKLLELEKSLNAKVMSMTSDNSLSILEVFDAAALVTLHCGVFSERSVKLIASDGMYESYGVEESKAVLATASKMLHTKQSGMDFDPRLAHRYTSRIKEAVIIMAGIWTLLCPEWFILQGEDSIPLHPQDSKLVLFESINFDCLDALFKMKFANGKEFDVHLHAQNVFKSFYANEEIYSIAKPPSCAIIDIVLSKGGLEAIAESYYSAMRAQQQSGGQSNETLNCPANLTQLVFTLT